MKINLKTDERFEGCYNGDTEKWDLYVDADAIMLIPTEISVSQDGETWFNSYLVSAKYVKKANAYELKYKDY